MNPYLISLIGYYSALYGIDPLVSLSVVQVESGFNSNLIGTAGEVGYFQLLPRSFPEIKISDLRKAEVNIQQGIKYLAWNKKYCNFKEDDTYLICWNFGIENAKKVKYPSKFPYVLKIKKVMKEFKKGQKVLVQNLYGNDRIAEATYIKPSKNVHEWKNCHEIQTKEDLIINVEDNRIEGICEEK